MKPCQYSVIPNEEARVVTIIRISREEVGREGVSVGYCFLYRKDIISSSNDHHKVFEGIDNDYVINERTSLMLTMDIKDVVVKGDTGATAFVRFIEPTERSTLDRPRLH
ncbi:10993_t:CDS:2 [Rhizophagus irregularis]|nr:10993_t:CDS:2 [Rhizophagus irregularis]